MSVDWAAPPSDRTGQSAGESWEERLTPAMERPDEWAMVGAFSTNAGACLRNGLFRKPPGEWEFVQRVTNHLGERAPGRKVWLYARYRREKGDR